MQTLRRAATPATETIRRNIRSGRGTDGERVYALPQYSRSRRKYLRSIGQSTAVDYHESGALLSSIQPAIIVAKGRQPKVSLIIRPTGKHAKVWGRLHGEQLASRTRKGIQRVSSGLPPLQGMGPWELALWVHERYYLPGKHIPPCRYLQRRATGAVWAQLPPFMPRNPAVRFRGAGIVWARIYRMLYSAVQVATKDARYRNSKEGTTSLDNRQIADALMRRMGAGRWAGTSVRATAFIEFAPDQVQQLLLTQTRQSKRIIQGALRIT